MIHKFLSLFALLAIFSLHAESTVIYQNGVSPLTTFLDLTNSPYVDKLRRSCPVCDSSVYPYCGEKLLHDSCCCHVPKGPWDQLPHECYYADCSFLHANSCREHKLISACCCTNLIYKRK